MIIKKIATVAAVVGAMSSAPAQAELDSMQHAWSNYNVAGNWLMGDVFTLVKDSTLGGIQFDARGISFSNVNYESNYGAQVFIAAFSGLGESPDQFNILWSSRFSGVAGTNQSAPITHFSFSPDIALAAGTYTAYVLTDLPKYDPASGSVTVTSTYDEDVYKYSWSSGTQNAYQVGMRFDGPTTINNNVSASIGLEFTQAIPEPETYAMLLAGLGLMGAFHRRKQK